MIAKICGYILTIVSAGMLVAMSQSLLTAPRLKRIAALSGGAILTLTTISPLVEADWDELRIERWNNASVSIDEMKIESEKQISDIIKRTTESYILDKAEQIGAKIHVNVSTANDNGYSYPNAVTITGVVSETQKNTLSAFLEQQLGIDPQRQVWKTI